MSDPLRFLEGLCTRALSLELLSRPKLSCSWAKTLLEGYLYGYYSDSDLEDDEEEEPISSALTRDERRGVTAGQAKLTMTSDLHHL